MFTMQRLPSTVVGMLLLGSFAHASPIHEPAANLPTSKGSVAIFYPQSIEPFKSILAKIIEGIEQSNKAPIKSYVIDKNVASTSSLNEQLKRTDTKVVIALGRDAIKVASSLERDVSVIVGGILTPPEIDQQIIYGMTLNPDPGLLLTRMKSLLPEVRRVFVVYNPQFNEALIKNAREAGKAQGIEIVPFEARDIATAARSYTHIFANSDKKRDALWIPNDATTSEEATIFPLILKESWNTSLPFFSSAFIHAKRGALFALYPNTLELGRNLGNSALGALAGDVRRKGVQPLREVNIAVNLRTAEHLGLRIDAQQQRAFDLVFPEP